MLKETLLNNNLIKLQGTLTSNIRTRGSSNTPYYAFFRKDDNNRHSRTICERNKCQECEIPVIFRLDSDESNKCCKFLNNWHNSDCQKLNPKPNLEKGNQVILQGQWATSDHSSRPSFTVYYYQLIND